jgi:hypothetical protein
MRLWSCAVFAVLLFLVWPVLQAGAQEAGPDPDEAFIYQAPGPLEGYVWHTGTGLSEPGALTVLYDGKAVFPASSADRCRLACNAFSSCSAFLFSEPVHAADAPQCRLLSRVSDDVEIMTGSHLYLAE